MTTTRRVLFQALFLGLVGATPSRAQTPITLQWDEMAALEVDGYAVTIDGDRADYHLTPLNGSGECGCSIALPFSGGRHIVVVSAYNAFGETAAPPIVLEPAAVAGGPYTARVGTPLVVDGSQSNHPAGALVSYDWNWGDGSSTQQPLPSASHTYAAPGSFTITLTVTDNGGASAAANAIVNVSEIPIATVPEPTSGRPPAVPSNPEPAPAATLTGSVAPPALRWSADGAATFDLHVIASGQPPLVVTGLALPSYALETIAADATYFWQVIARSDGGVAYGPVWSFKTSAGCPCSLFDGGVTPGAAADDNSAVELGMKFTAEVSGSVSGVRFYKDPLNGGTHTGSLWSADGALLATVTFTNESGAGWQQAMFSTPVAIDANAVYVVSYHADRGAYIATVGGLTQGTDRAPLHAPPSGSSGGNGVYAYGSSRFPDRSWSGTNYWVDVVFER